MAERESVLEGILVGVESSSGTAVDATRRLTTYALTPTIDREVTVNGNQGLKFGGVSQPGLDQTSWSYEGPLTYNESNFMLSTILGAPTVAQIGTSTAYRFTFTPDIDGADTKKTLTVEQGSTQRAHEVTYFHTQSWGMKFNRSGEVTNSGTAMSQEISDDITLTNAATWSDITEVPVIADQWDVYVDTTSASLGSTQFTRVFEAELNLNDWWSTISAINSSEPSWVEAVHNPDGKGELKLKVEANAQGMGLLTDLEPGTTKYIRLLATGGTLGTSTYSFQIDGAWKMTKPDSFEDQDGVYALGWNFELVADTTWNKAIEFQVVNDLTALA